MPDALYSAGNPTGVQPGSVPAGTRIGHVHLKVADLDRAVWFYHEVMGFDVNFKFDAMAFLSAGGYHHHIGLNTWESLGGKPAEPGTTGLYHFAINYPTRRDLATALKRLLDHGWTIDGAKDHTSHEALYLHDPDFNGIELAWDRDPSYWAPWFGASPDQMDAINVPLDFDSLMAELGAPEATDAAKYLPTLRAFT
jgi:catechol 2,3-dioxygenase